MSHVSSLSSSPPPNDMALPPFVKVTMASLIIDHCHWSLSSSPLHIHRHRSHIWLSVNSIHEILKFYCFFMQENKIFWKISVGSNRSIIHYYFIVDNNIGIPDSTIRVETHWTESAMSSDVTSDDEEEMNTTSLAMENKSYVNNWMSMRIKIKYSWLTYEHKHDRWMRKIMDVMGKT